MSESVYILGGGRTDFKRNLKKEGKTIRHIIIEAGKKAIDDAKIDPGAIQAGAVGNFNSGQFTKQLQLGAFIPEIDPKLRGIPTMHTEAACASGALSVLLGAEWIMGGFYEIVRAHCTNLHRKIWSDRSGPGARRVEKLCARQVESAGANARRRSHVRLRITSFR